MTSTPKKKTILRRFLRLTAGLITSGIVIVAALLLFVWASMSPLPSFDEVKADHRPSDARLLDRHGEELHQLRVNFNARQGSWTRLEDISPALLNALLVSEDKHFWEHHGVDIGAVAAAIWNNLNQANPRGASTITMQLVGILDENIAPSGRRTLWHKMQQTVSAVSLERLWDKNQILEAYLNIVPFRGELVGISALSEGLFDKSPNGLNNREAAIAIAMLRAPNATEATIARRACTILQNVQATDAQQECALLPDFIRVRFAQPRSAPSQGIAPHLAHKLLTGLSASSNSKPLEVRTTLDAQVQRIALNSLRQHLQEMSNKNVEDGAVIVIENATGEVLAWVGSSGDGISQAAQIDAVVALRQPGSTLKPFLYAVAIEEKRLTAASLLNDSPLNLNVGGGLYAPQNYDKDYHGWSSVRTSLASSLNIPAVRTLVMVGPDVFAQTLVKLGLPLKETGDYYGYSLALGSAEVTLLTLTNAFRALSNGGQVSSVRWLPATLPSIESPSSEKKFELALEMTSTDTGISPQTAWIIGSILSDREARVPTFGLDSELNTRYWSAVKTGTSKDMRDNWAIGYSARYTVGVWVGNASGAAMWDVSGTSGATPVWRDVMNFLYQRDADDGHISDWATPLVPEGITASYIHYEPAIEPNRTEWFITGTQQEVITMSSASTHNTTSNPDTQARILEPASGTIIALDPDIPPENQRLWLLSNRSDVSWQIGDHVIARGAQVAWLPLPGRHRITLTDGQGNKLDSISLEVRGASLRASPRSPTESLPLPVFTDK